MYQSTAICQCGKSKVTITLLKPLNEYQPRACNCSYCVTKNLMYLSEPEGEITVRSAALSFEQQGDKLTSFLLCRHCNDVIAVVYCDKSRQLGAVNATLFTQPAAGTPVEVSPGKLTAMEKVERWKRVWSPLRLSDC